MEIRHERSSETGAVVHTHDTDTGITAVATRGDSGCYVTIQVPADALCEGAEWTALALSFVHVTIEAFRELDPLN